MSVHDITYKNIGHTHPGTVIIVEKVGYNPPNEGVESERNLSLTLSSFHSEKPLETHEIFHPEK